MTTTVADATGLILLAKTALLSALCDHDRMVTPAAVYEEVCGADAAARHPDAAIVQDIVRAGGLTVIQAVVSDEFASIGGLGPGEREALSAVAAGLADRILSDDGRMIRICRRRAIAYLTTPAVVVGLHRNGAIPGAQARHALDRLRILGRYSPDIIARFLSELREV